MPILVIIYVIVIDIVYWAGATHSQRIGAILLDAKANDMLKHRRRTRTQRHGDTAASLHYIQLSNGDNT